MLAELSLTLLMKIVLIKQMMYGRYVHDLRQRLGLICASLIVGNRISQMETSIADGGIQRSEIDVRAVIYEHSFGLCGR